MNSILLYLGHEMCGGMVPWSWRPYTQVTSCYFYYVYYFPEPRRATLHEPLGLWPLGSRQLCAVQEQVLLVSLRSGSGPCVFLGNGECISLSRLIVINASRF